MKAQVLYGINDMRYEDIEEPQSKIEDRPEP